MRAGNLQQLGGSTGRQFGVQRGQCDALSMRHLVQHLPDRSPLAKGPNPFPVTEMTARRQDPWQEPGASTLTPGTVRRGTRANRFLTAMTIDALLRFSGNGPEAASSTGR